MCSNTKLSLVKTTAHTIIILCKLHRYCYNCCSFFYAVTFNHFTSITHISHY